VQAGVALELAEARKDTERLVVLEERDRIAKDLHDVVIQRLFASAMTLMSTLRLITSPEAEERVQRTIDELDSTIRAIRSTIFALQNPPSRGESSLRDRILELAENTAHSLGCHPGISLDGPIDASVPHEIGEQLLAVLGEGLTNVARHAKATEVHASVVVEEPRPPSDDATTLTLTITDNGVGLPEEGRRSGLRNLDQRAEALGGHFTARRAARGGPSLVGTGPLAAAADDVVDGSGPAVPVAVSVASSPQFGDEHGRLSTSFEVQLGEQGRHVVLHGLLGEVEAFPDLSVGHSLTDEVEDLAFLRGEFRQRIGFGLGATQAFQHRPGTAGVQQRATGGDGAHRTNQVGTVDLLEDVPGRTRHDGVVERVLIGERGEHEAGDLGV